MSTTSSSSTESSSSSSSSSEAISIDTSSAVAGTTEDQQARTLIVNYLPQRISEAELGRMFEPYGTVEHVKLMLDRRTHVSMGYGFVRYAAIESTDRAIAALNGTPIDNKMLRVSHSRPPTAQETNLYVGNIDPSVTRDVLAQLLSRYGKVVDAKVLVDRATGQGKGYGFVRMERREECDAAIAGLHGAILPSISTRGLAVRYHRTTTSPQLVGGRRYVSSSSSSSASGMSSSAGQGGGSMYPVYPIASPYVSMMTMPFVPGLVIPQQAQQSGQRQTFQGVCVFVYNLPQDTEPSMLRQLFAPHGTVLTAKVMRNVDGRCRGFGFVNLSSMDEALRAISALNGITVMGKTLQVSLKTDKQPTM